jgi:hypothetical protein
MWGLGACFALFPAQLTAVFEKISVANPLFILAVYAPGISAIIVSGLRTSATTNWSKRRPLHR